MPKYDDPEVRPTPFVLHDWDGAAEVLGVSPRLVRELWAKRELAGVKVGRRVRFRSEDLIDYVDRHRVEAKR